MGESKYVDGVHEEHMDEFLEDLRSGKYEQGTGNLEDSDGRFCCLGVACIRPAAEGVVSRTVNEENFPYYDNNSAELPQSVADYLGIPERNRTGVHFTDVKFYKVGFRDLEPSAIAFTAIGLNDTLGKSFAEIADAFEIEFKREN